MLPPITIARSLPVCPTPATTVSVMCVSPSFCDLRSACRCLTNHSHTHETKHALGLLIPEMCVKSLCRCQKDREYFPGCSVVELNFSKRAQTTEEGINSERACLGNV